MTPYYLVAGGEVSPKQLRETYRRDAAAGRKPLVVGADRGTLIAEEAGIPVAEAVGDFDSVTEEEYADICLFHKDSGTLQKLNPVKDDTDYEHALRWILAQEPSEITAFGATGTRLDQTLSAISLLKLALEQRVPMTLLDPHNRIRMIRNHFVLEKEEQFGKYLSLIPWGGDVTSVTIKGVKYETENLTLPMTGSRGISNEITGSRAEIFCRGLLILMETKDE